MTAFQPQYLHFCWNLLRRTAQKAEINEGQRFTGSTQRWASVNQLDGWERERQVKDLFAYFLLEISKNWVFKLPEREESSNFFVVKTQREMWNCIKLTDAWKWTNCHHRWKFSLVVYTYVVGKEPEGTKNFWRSNCTQGIDKSNHCKTKINQTRTENIIYTFTASSSSHIVQTLDRSYRCSCLGQSHISGLWLQAPDVSGT